MAHFSKTGRIDIVITYSDIKAKRNDALVAQKAYAQKIRDTAKKLMDAYIHSLQLPSEQWSDIQGTKHPYVYIQSNGFEEAVEDIRVNFQDGASFDLLTVTDDDPRAPQTEKVQVSINVTDGKLEVGISGYRVERFSPVDSDAKINEICEFIKDSILMSMSDFSLGNGVAKNAVNLWD